jgi:hypothetical protein
MIFSMIRVHAPLTSAFAGPGEPDENAKLLRSAVQEECRRDAANLKMSISEALLLRA